MVVTMAVPTRGGARPAGERWLVTGACGQLGAHVTRRLAHEALAGDVTVVGAGRRPCSGDHGEVLAADLEDERKLARVLDDVAPTHVVHLAGITSPVAAERDPLGAWSLAVGATEQIAEHVAATGAWMLFASSDFVWDGAGRGRYLESDVPRPQTVYGRSKLAGEQAVLAAEAGAVARFSLLYGLPECPRETSWARFVRAVEAGELVPACVDEYRTPVALADAARIVVELGRLDHHGLLHVAGPDALTAHDMLTALARAAGVAPRLRPISRTTLSAEIVRPRNVAMDGGALAALLPHAAPRAISATTPATRHRAPERPPDPWPPRIAAPARAAAPLAS